MHNEKEKFKSGYTVQVIRGPLAGELAIYGESAITEKRKRIHGRILSLYNKSLHAVVIADDFPENK